MVIKFLAKQGLGLLGKKKTLTTTTKYKDAMRIKKIDKLIKKTPKKFKQDVYEGHMDEVQAIFDKGKK